MNDLAIISNAREITLPKGAQLHPEPCNTTTADIHLALDPENMVAGRSYQYVAKETVEIYAIDAEGKPAQLMICAIVADGMVEGFTFESAGGRLVFRIQSSGEMTGHKGAIAMWHKPRVVFGCNWRPQRPHQLPIAELLLE